jgi:hypothetical protein
MKTGLSALVKVAFRLSSLTLAVGVFPPSASAQELVTNGTFATNINGWQIDSGSTGISSNYALAFFDTRGITNFLSQSLTTTDFATTTYRLSFDIIYTVGDTPSEFIVKWGGQTIYDQSNPSGPSAIPGIETITFDNLTAASASTLLTLGGFGTAEAIGFDNVSVTATGNAPSAVPEPATYSTLFGAAVLGFAACRRRQTRA